MNILFCSDDNYARYLCVTLHSIIKNSKINDIKFYIFDLGIKEENKKSIKKILKNHSLIFQPIDKNVFSDFPQTISHISLATYARLKAADYLPNIDKIIYLDVDVLINGQLELLWKIKLDDYWCGACFDSYIEYETKCHKNLIGLNNDEPYFNAGVLLINLKKWRENNLYEKSLCFLKEKGNKLQYQDQDILNGILKGNVLILNSRFNFMPTLHGRIVQSHKKKIMLNEYEETTYPIIIYHYCSANKAWNNNCYHTNARLFNKLAKEIDQPFNKVNLKTRWKRFKNDLKNRIRYGIY